MTDRESHRAAVEAGYASLAEYIKKWGDDKMNIVEQLRRHQCPENKGCNPVVDYCQCALMDSGADEIERLREALKEIAADASVAHGTDKQMWKGWRKIATTRIDIARSALQQKETE